ncbi:MAG: thermonuclease family protein [Rhodospirillaceae bacterium]
MLAFAMLLAMLLAMVPARSAELGPVNADVIRVIDGDTVEVRAAVWLGQSLVTRVRVLGIDAPDKDCPMMQERATQKLRDLMGPTTVLSKIRFGKYAGRVLARLTTKDGRDLGRVLLHEGLAHVYDGRGKRGGFVSFPRRFSRPCGCAAAVCAWSGWRGAVRPAGRRGRRPPPGPCRTGWAVVSRVFCRTSWLQINALTGLCGPGRFPVKGHLSSGGRYTIVRPFRAPR